MKLIDYGRFDAIRFRNKFIHNDSRVSSERIKFHTNSYLSIKGRRKAKFIGVDRREQRVSGFGIVVDGKDIGQSE